jgi:hypothetical protein
MGVVRDLLRRLTPWYDEDEVTSRENTTQTVVKESHQARRDAEAEFFKSYRKAGEAIGRHQWAPDRKR